MYNRLDLVNHQNATKGKKPKWMTKCRTEKGSPPGNRYREEAAFPLKSVTLRRNAPVQVTDAGWIGQPTKRVND